MAREAVASLLSESASAISPSGEIRIIPAGREILEDFEDRSSLGVPLSGQALEAVPVGFPPMPAGFQNLSPRSRLSIVIPTLNEAENVSKLIVRIESLFQEEPEVIIVDDNSSDGTIESVVALRQRFRRIRIIRRAGRGGIGSAVRDGIRFALEHSDSDHVATMDADWSHDPGELPALLEAARDADFVQGSRYAEGGRIVGWPLTRRLLSIVGNNACRFLFRTGLREHTTFYRVFNRECAELVVANVRDDGYAWGVRSLVEALGAGLRAREIPITFVERENGKSKLGVRELVGWFFSIVRLLGQRRHRLEKSARPPSIAPGSGRDSAVEK